MNTEKLDKLIEKAKRLQSTIYYDSYEMEVLEHYLKVKMPADFKYICSKYAYDIGLWLELKNVPFDIISSTERYRQQKGIADEALPHKYVVLADEGDGGIVLMETQDDPEKPTPIYWCDWQDIDNLATIGKFKFNPDIWPSFTDFFEYCVNKQASE